MKKKKKKKASDCTEHLSTARAIIHRHVRHSILLSDIIMSCGAFYHLVRHYIVLPEIISSSQILYCLVGHSINLSGIILSCQTFYTLVRHSIVLSDNLSRIEFFCPWTSSLFWQVPWTWDIWHGLRALYISMTDRLIKWLLKMHKTQ